MWGLLAGLLGILFAAGVAFVFPVRNAVRYRGRPWATWGLLGANLAVFLAILWTRWFGVYYGVSRWYETLIFTGDFSRPWTLVTSLFIHGHPLILLVSLWFFYLIAPILEERLKWFGLLLLYLGGGAATLTLYGLLCQTVGARIWSVGMSPALCVLLGFYLVLFPFEEIVFFYNLLFFAFTGTVAIATIYLVLFATLLNGLSGLIASGIVLGLIPHRTGSVAWITESIPLLGLLVGFLTGTLRYGLGAFVGKSPGGDDASPADRMLQRALKRLGEEEAGPDRPRRPSRHEKAKFRQALGEDAPPEEIEAFAEQCLANQRQELLEASYARFRGRFPERCFGPGLQAAVARRFEQTGRADLAADAYRLLIASHEKLPVAADARFHLAKLLSTDPTASEEAISQLEAFLEGKPPREAADEARTLLDRMIEASGRGDTYAGLSPFKPFHFSKAEAVRGGAPLPTPAGAPSQPEGLAIGRSAEPIMATRDGAETVKPKGMTQQLQSVADIVPDSQGETLAEWRVRPAESSELTAAVTAARTFAVIMLPSKTPLTKDKLTLLSDFWAVGPAEAADFLRRSQGVMLDDAPSGRAVVLVRKLRSLGLPVTMIPLLPDIVYPTCEDVLEFQWNLPACSNVTTLGRRVFEWEQIRLANLAQVALPGAGQAYRTVLDLFVAEPHCRLRFWEATVNFGRSSLEGQQNAANSLQTLAVYLDKPAAKAMKTPSFRRAVRGGESPTAFNSLAELDQYERWFLYVGFGKYAAGP